jgi:hypothetical protein
MASTGLGDIPGARFAVPIVATHASVASGGANARLGAMGPFDHPIRVRSAWWTPTGADVGGTSTASYRRLSVYAGGTAGTATATASRLASLDLTATKASHAPVAMTVANTTHTVSAGGIVYFSQETVGGASATNTELAAGQVAISYEVV